VSINSLVDSVRLAVGEKEAAKALNMSVAWLRKDRRTKRIIPFFKLGDAVRYDLGRVRDAIAAIEEGGTAKPRSKKVPA
jgi:hypothetical protein